jgi:hypothetical protein
MKSQSDSIIPSFLVITTTANFLSENVIYEVICHQLSWFVLIFALYSYCCKTSNVYCNRIY